MASIRHPRQTQRAGAGVGAHRRTDFGQHRLDGLEAPGGNGQQFSGFGFGVGMQGGQAQIAFTGGAPGDVVNDELNGFLFGAHAFERFHPPAVEL